MLNDFRNLSQDDLLSAIKSALAPEPAAQAPLPVPPGTDRASMTPEAADRLARAWAGDILTKPGVWTREESESVRAGIADTLREMGYR